MSLVTPSTRLGDLLAELLAHLLQRGGGVLDRVVQQRGAQRLGVEPHAGADLGHADRVDDEVLARLAPLVGVVHAGVDERVLDPVAVDRPPRPGRRAPRRSRTGRRAAGARSRSARPARPCRGTRGARPDRRAAARAAIASRPRPWRRRRRPAVLPEPGRSPRPRPRTPSPTPTPTRHCPAWRGLRSGSVAWPVICAAQVSPSVLISLCVGPVGRRALERRSAPSPRSPGPADPGRG